jgi:urease accessory protein
LHRAPAPVADGAETRAKQPSTAGRGHLRVAPGDRRSVVTRAFATSPLRLLTPRNHGHAAWVFTSTYGGGLVDGDALRLDVDVEASATALLATQAATKVYRSGAARRGAAFDLHATIAPGALLVISPDPVVCFAGSQYRQHQTFHLDGTAGLVYVDWLTAGRRAAGERWQFDRYESRLTVRRDGRPVLLDALTLSPVEGELPRRLGRFDTICLVALIGASVEPHAAALVSQLSNGGVARRAGFVCGASRIDGGAVAKIAATSVEAVARAVREYLAFVPALLGDDPWARKW